MWLGIVVVPMMQQCFVVLAHSRSIDVCSKMVNGSGLTRHMRSMHGALRLTKNHCQTFRKTKDLTIISLVYVISVTSNLRLITDPPLYSEGSC